MYFILINLPQMSRFWLAFHAEYTHTSHQSPKSCQAWGWSSKTCWEWFQHWKSMHFKKLDLLNFNLKLTSLFDNHLWSMLNHFSKSWKWKTRIIWEKSVARMDYFRSRSDKISRAHLFWADCKKSWSFDEMKCWNKTKL